MSGLFMFSICIPSSSLCTELPTLSVHRLAIFQCSNELSQVLFLPMVSVSATVLFL